MNLKDFVAVTGYPGIQRAVATRKNGMLVADIDTGKVRFAAIRKHQFSPLETISIFTDDGESSELKNVFQSMLDQLTDNPPPAENSDKNVLREYFTKILPNHDQDKVHISDIKKTIRWFLFLNERNLWGGIKEEDSDEEE